MLVELFNEIWNWNMEVGLAIHQWQMDNFLLCVGICLTIIISGIVFMLYAMLKDYLELRAYYRDEWYKNFKRLMIDRPEDWF